MGTLLRCACKGDARRRTYEQCDGGSGGISGEVGAAWGRLLSPPNSGAAEIESKCSRKGKMRSEHAAGRECGRRRRRAPTTWRGSGQSLYGSLAGTQAVPWWRGSKDGGRGASLVVQWLRL